MTFGLSSLIPLEGESAGKRWCASVGATDEIDATDPVEDFRMPLNDSDSRFALRSPIPMDIEVLGPED